MGEREGEMGEIRMTGSTDGHDMVVRFHVG